MPNVFLAIGKIETLIKSKVVLFYHLQGVEAENAWAEIFEKDGYLFAHLLKLIIGISFLATGVHQIVLRLHVRSKYLKSIRVDKLTNPVAILGLVFVVQIILIKIIESYFLQRLVPVNFDQFFWCELGGFNRVTILN